MAYTKYFFNQGSAQSNRDDVVNWLSENATDYFDSFEAEDNAPKSKTVRLVKCNIGDKTVLKFATYSPAIGDYYNLYTTLYISTLGGYTASETGMPYSNQEHTMARYAIKTDSGIMLYMDDSHAIYITKSNAGTTAVYVKWVRSQTDSAPVLCWKSADLSSSTRVDTTALGDHVMEADMTSLGPVCFAGGTFAPDLYLTPYAQYKGRTGLIYVDGTVYAYDGYVGLKC